GVRRGQAAGGGAGLVVAGVDPPRARIDEPRQGVDVRGLELRQLAVLDQEARHLVPHRGELLEHVVIGGRSGLGLLEDRQLVLLEQHVAELRRRVDVEFGAGGPVDRPLELGELERELARDLPQPLEIDPHAAPLHLDEDGNERNLDLLEQPKQLVVLELGPERLAQPQHRLAVAAGVARRLRARNGASASLASAGRLRGWAPPASSPSGATCANGRYHERPGAAASDRPTSSARIGSSDDVAVSSASRAAARHAATMAGRATGSSTIVGSTMRAVGAGGAVTAANRWPVGAGPPAPTPSSDPS